MFFSTVAHADVIAITAQGTVASSCDLALASNFTSANLAASGSATATATINCNSGFTLKATSTKGAIKTTNSATTGFTNSLPYTLGLSVIVDTAGPFTASCASSTLVAGQSSCALSPSGTGLSTGTTAATAKTTTLTASWTLGTTKLIAGSYSDTITLSIAAAP